MTAWAKPRIVDALLAEQRVLRVLARALVDDADLADDLVQEAIADGARRIDAPRGARALLATIVRRRAQNARRDRARRAARERQAARPERVPSAAEMAARHELCRHVGDAVLALDEPYRTTVWLRFFDGLPPREVARRMRVPVATVRTRLQRALARLRAVLDRDYGDRRAWAAALLPLLGRGTPALGLLALAGTMKKLTFALGVAALAAAVVLWSWPFARGGPPEEAAGQTAAPIGVQAQAPPAERAPLAPAAAATAATPPQSALVEGRVLHDDGTPAAGLPVWVWGEERPAWTRPVEVAQPLEIRKRTLPPPDGSTDGEGVFALMPRVSPRAITCCLDEQLWLTFELVDGEGDYVLPSLGTVSLELEGWRPGDTWSARLYSFAETESGIEAVTYSTRRIATRSGKAALTQTAPPYGIRCKGPRIELTAVVGERYEVSPQSRVLAFQPASARVWCGETAAFRIAHRHPILEIRLVEPTGELARSVDARVLLHSPGRALTHAEPLRGGRAVLQPHEDCSLLTVLTADGELLRASAPSRIPDGETVKVTFRRGDGVAAWRFSLPEGVGCEEINAIAVEDRTGWLETADTIEKQSFMDANQRDEITWLPLGDCTLGVLSVAQDLERVLVVLRDGRVAVGRFPGGSARGAPIQPLVLLPSRAFAPLDTEAMARERGARRGRISWRIRMPDRRGDMFWFYTDTLDFAPWTRDWPVWEMHAPEGWQVEVMFWDFDRQGVFLPPPPLHDAAK